MISKNINNIRSGFFPLDTKHLVVTAIFSLLYLLWTYAVVGFRPDHFTFLIFMVGMMVLHSWTRAINYGFIFFILFWVIYDSMRIYPSYLFNDVNILEPYLIEKSLFGIQHLNETLTPNEYLNVQTNTWSDVLSGIFYLTWVPVPMILALYLFFTDKKMLLRFTAAFLFTNLVGFCIYYLYPAAPPWYFAKYGDSQLFNIPGETAGLARFDNWVGSPIFQNMYTKNANVFAAIPSLHAAYPVVAWYYARKSKLKWASLFIIIDIIGIWWAAVYSYHHYLLDVLLGAGCAVIAISIFEGWLIKTRLDKWLDKYISFTQGE